MNATGEEGSRRVLVIAYFFPPLGGAGVQRVVKFVRYLPENGWHPTVLTARNSRYWLLDPTLADQIPPSTRVVRAASPDGLQMASWLSPQRSRAGSVVRGGASTSRLRRWASWGLLPDAYRPWKPFALRAARRILRHEPIDVIYTTSSPDTTHLIGLDLARESGIPWVADFRDPWTRRIAFDPPSPLHRRWHVAREREVLAAADRVVVTADETRDDFLARHPRVSPAKFAVIPNGYDRDDFPEQVDPPDWERFSIVYVGQLTAGRTVAPLIPVLDGFFATRPDARSRTRVRFLGPREGENDRLVEAAGLGDVVRFESPRPHREAVEVLGTAHVILLLEHMGPRAGLIAQGKLYECLYAERPILALVPHGAVSRLIGAYGGGVAATDADPGPAVAFLQSAFDAWRGRTLLPGASRSNLGGFERRALTRDLAALFRSL